MLLSGQPKVEHLVIQQIKPITMELLRIIRDTENDDLTSVMQKIVCTYHEQLMPIAVEICQHLVSSFYMGQKRHWDKLNNNKMDCGEKRRKKMSSF